MGQDIPLCPIGLYIHIPWCISKCGYCNFFSLSFNRTDFDIYIQTLQDEKALYQDILSGEVDTVYFGGGTPSLLSAQDINKLLRGIRLSNNAEISIEVNPLQVTKEFVDMLCQTPINRISLGIQSMSDVELHWLTRKHKAAMIEPAIKLLRERGYKNISGDMIYGLPNSTVQSVKNNIAEFQKLQLNHISCYLLELCENSPLYRFHSDIPSDEILAKQYHAIRKMLRSNGYMQYEISNFALPGFESQHNLKYWKSGDYLALGASACGNIQGMKYQNPANLREYSAHVSQKDRFVGCDDGKYAIQDYIMMRLRLKDGLPFGEFQQRFGFSFWEGREKVIAKLTTMGMILVSEDSICLTEDALFVSNTIIGDLI